LGRQSQSTDFWSDAGQARELLKERALLEDTVASYNSLFKLYANLQVACEILMELPDPETQIESQKLLQQLEDGLTRMEFMRKMSGRFDATGAILEINSGSGGTEAQDWAEMLLRMYLRWAEKKGFKAEQLDYQPGEAAGIKSVTILFNGGYAYGHLRSEQGVHRLVRISPFDSNARRHTSFASVAVTPDIEEEIEIEIEEGDLKIDTYRSSGAGGQHVNKTDSAVRITHLPSGIVVACQNERSQHKNRAQAMKILRAKVYELECRKQEEAMAVIKGERKQIDFGSQIRSYVMQPYQLVKDLRSNFETSQVGDVLDGDLDALIEAYLMMAKEDSTGLK
jgi:peptide chain release factor 2